MSRDILFDHGNARFSYRISALIVQNGRVLLQCPVGTQDYAFIGGHVEFGETARETLVREIREEIHAAESAFKCTADGEFLHTHTLGVDVIHPAHTNKESFF